MGSDLLIEGPPEKPTSIKEHDPIPCKQHNNAAQHPTQQTQLNLNNKEAECLVKLKEMIRGTWKTLYQLNYLSFIFNF